MTNNNFFNSILIILVSVVAVFKGHSATVSSNKISLSKNDIKIQVYYGGDSSSFDLEVIVANKYFENQDNPNNLHVRPYQIKDGWHFFAIPQKEFSGYIQVLNIKEKVAPNELISRPTITPIFFSERTDSVSIKIVKKANSPVYLFDYKSKYSYSFSGRGSEKYQLQLTADSILVYTKKTSFFDSSYTYKNGYKKAIDAANDWVDKNAHSTSANAKDVIKADLTYKGGHGKFLGIIDFHNTHISRKDTNTQKLFREAYKNSELGNYEMVVFSKGVLSQSMGYIQHCVDRIKTYSLIVNNSNNPFDVYHLIKSSFSGKIREEVIVAFLCMSEGSEHQQEVFDDAVKTIQTPYLKEKLNLMKNRLPGTKLPSFTLFDTQNKPQLLNEYYGDVSVLDLWFSGCGGCSALYSNTLSKVEHYFKGNTRVRFLSVSVDWNINIWKKGLNSGEYTSIDAVNLFTGSKSLQHPLISFINAETYPTVVLLDKDGKIIDFNGIALRNKDELIKLINSELEKRSN